MAQNQNPNPNPNPDPGKKKNASIPKDAFQMFISFVVPFVVRKTIENIPDLTYEKFVAHYQEYWDVALPAFAWTILRAFNSPDMIDDLTTELLAEAKKAMDMRTRGADPSGSATPVKKDGIKNDCEKVIILAAGLEEALFKQFLTRLSGITDEHQKDKLANYLLPIKTGVATLTAWSKLKPAEFKRLIDLIIPPVKPREDSELEKLAKKGIAEFKDDIKGSLSKKSWFVKFAEEVSNTQIN